MVRCIVIVFRGFKLWPYPLCHDLYEYLSAFYSFAQRIPILNVSDGPFKKTENNNVNCDFPIVLMILVQHGILF